jgi:hypothetical protein
MICLIPPSVHIKFSILQGCIQKFPDWVNNEINNNNNNNNNNNKHSLRSNTKGYGGKTH